MESYRPTDQKVINIHSLASTLDLNSVTYPNSVCSMTSTTKIVSQLDYCNRLIPTAFASFLHINTAHLHPAP